MPDPAGDGNLTIVLWLGVAASKPNASVLSWTVMAFHGRSASRLTLAAAASLMLLGIAAPSSTAAPTSDDQGYVDSTARCSAPDDTVVFGSTASSRIAICDTSAGGYEYRGVRVRDGAKLVVPASRTDDGAFLAENDGITYLVTASSLVVSAGTQVIRDEPMVEFHGPDAPETPTESTTPTTPLPPPLPAEVGGSG
jgi:hypothetical protein